MKRTTIYDDFTNKIDEWDFEKNLEIDILSEDTNSVKNASWICSNCGFHYVDKIKSHSTCKCPKCGMTRLTKDLQSYDILKFKCCISGIIVPLILSIILYFALYGIEYKFVNITKDIIISILLSVLAFIQIATFIWSATQNKLFASADFITKSRLLYNLMERGENYETLKYNYENTIINRLVFLCKNEQLTKNTNSFRNIIQTLKNSDIGEWFDAKDKKEVSYLIKNLRTSYFDKLYSRFETKEMIEFESSYNLWEHIATLVSGIISLVLSVVTDINDSSFLQKKLIGIGILFIMYATYIVLSYKKRLQAFNSNIMRDIIYVSPAIAKKSTHNFCSQTE